MAQLCSVPSFSYFLLFCQYAVNAYSTLNTNSLLLTADLGPLLWDTAQLVLAVPMVNRVWLSFLVLTHTVQEVQSFRPRLMFLSHINQWKETEVLRFNTAKLTSEQIIIPNQLPAIESWLMRCSGGHRLAWMDFKQWCGTSPLWKAAIQNEDKVIKWQQLSLDLGFFFIFFFSSIAYCDEYE